jgi:hypothetical protein
MVIYEGLEHFDRIKTNPRRVISFGSQIPPKRRPPVELEAIILNDYISPRISSILHLFEVLILLLF